MNSQAASGTLVSASSALAQVDTQCLDSRAAGTRAYPILPTTLELSGFSSTEGKNMRLRIVAALPSAIRLAGSPQP